ncbi:MAG: hypothetical protein U9N87_04615 [Planctomycetota bacterium]|nr:hypothetical protein [Planctomycetota bacterium]
MGYSIHIERNEEQWDADSGGGIRLEEWKAYVQSDESMRFDKVAEITTSHGDVIRYESEGRVLWFDTSHGELGGKADELGGKADELGGKAWFDFHHGRIFANNPNAETIRKMHQIASHFDAKMVGEDGEEYLADGKIRDSDSCSSSVKKPWWKFW